MQSIAAFVKQHSVLSYYLLTFALSWGGVFLVVGGPAGFPATQQQFDELLPFVVLFLASGPVLAGLVMTVFVSGKAGLRDLLSHLLTWRVGAAWYAVALLTAPLVVLATLLVLALFSANFLPGIFSAEDTLSILLPGLAAGLVAGLFEEPGWTGFAIPRLKARYSILAAGLIAGVLWGVWHFIVALWGGGTADGALALPLFLSQLAFYVGVLPAYRVLMVWVYDHTKSLLVAMLMHASLTAVTIYIFAPPVTDEQRLLYHLVLSAVVWGVVAAVALAGQRLTQPSLRSHTA